MQPAYAHANYTDAQRAHEYPDLEQYSHSPNIDPSLQQLQPSIEPAGFGAPVSTDGYSNFDQPRNNFSDREDGLELPDSNFGAIASLQSPDRYQSYHVNSHADAQMTDYADGEEEDGDPEDPNVFGPRPQRFAAHQPQLPAPYDQPFANAGPASYAAPFQPMSAAPSPFGTEFSPESGDGKRINKQRQRGKFNDLRKREVQAVRKLGACLRCRMLKKPCSQGDTCEACEKIEDPRLWHFECTRTRLEAAFSHFSSGIHSTSAYANEITPLRNSSPFDSAKTIIDATQASETGIYLSMQSHHGWPLPRGEREDSKTNNNVISSIEGNSREGRVAAPAGNPDVADGTAPVAGVVSDVAAANDITGHAADVTSSQGAPAGSENQEVFVLNHEDNDIPTMIRTYVQGVLPHFVATEPSDFMRVVLDIAQTKAEQFDNDHPEVQSPSAAPQKGRRPDESKYNIVKLALEMWAVVKVLLDTDLTWNLSKRTAGDNAGTGTPILPHEESYRLIGLQLKAAAETKAADLVKQVVGIVERQLLKTSSKDHFDLFIVGLIILNTLEKATWLFEKFNRPTFVVAFPLQGDSDGPTPFVDSRIAIVKLLNILLRMRGVPPSTQEDNNGILTTHHDIESHTFYDRVSLSRKSKQAAAAINERSKLTYSQTPSFLVDSPWTLSTSLS
jgi:hypothetical protein